MRQTVSNMREGTGARGGLRRRDGAGRPARQAHRPPGAGAQPAQRPRPGRRACSRCSSTAGATITGRVDVQDKFINPDNNSNLLELAVTAARPTAPDRPACPATGTAWRPPARCWPASCSTGPPGARRSARPTGGRCSRRTANAGYLTTDGAGHRRRPRRSWWSAASRTSTRTPPKQGRVGGQDRRAVRPAPARSVVAGNGSAGGNVVAVVRGDPVLRRPSPPSTTPTPCRGSWSPASRWREQITDEEGRPVRRRRQRRGRCCLNCPSERRRTARVRDRPRRARPDREVA